MKFFSNFMLKYWHSSFYYFFYMKKNRFIHVFISLSKQDQQAFNSLVHCVTFNKREKLALLLDQWTRYPDMSLKHFFELIYPKEQYDPKRIHALFGALYKLLLRFLAWQELQQDNNMEAILGLQALRKLNADNAFESEAKRIKKHLKAMPYKDDQYYWAEYLVAREEDYYLTQRQIREQTVPLQTRLDAFDNFYLGTKFALSAEALSRNQIIGEAYQSSWAEPLGVLFDEQPAPHMDTIWMKLQRQLLRCLEEPEAVQHYEQLISMLQTHRDLLPLDTARFFYKSAQNYCIRCINAGETDFQKLLFELFQMMLEQKLLLNEADQIAHSDVKNIVTVALRQGESLWAKQFMDEYAPRIQQGQRNNVLSYCKALLESHRGKPAEAIRRLREVTFTDVMYDLSARRLLGQIFFEEEDWDGLLHHLNAFEQFLRRQKQLSTHNRNSHLNYVKILRAIAKMKEKAFFTSKEKIVHQQKKLRERIERTEPLAYREWLLLQIKE